MDMLLLLVILIDTSSADNITCHCVRNGVCSANGFCTVGCDQDWSGPGCQVGNVALKKTTTQSSTYSSSTYIGHAELAVDGIVPVAQMASEQHCSHTAVNQNSAWWYVTLSTTANFVVTQVTLVNRRDNTDRLKDFTILYSNETYGNPDPSAPIWSECARVTGISEGSQDYTCHSTAIAKRVAVYLLYSKPILTLCEVKVFGYELYECPSGFTGPGCLLTACDAQCYSQGGKCDGAYGSCRRSVCPDRSLQPPDCWITLSNYSDVNIQSNTTCNTVQLSVEISDSQPNIPASTLLLQVKNTSDQTTLVNTTLSVNQSSVLYYNFSSAEPGATYDISVTPVYCNITNLPCFYATGSKVFKAVTGVRNYVISNNNSCFAVNVHSTNAGCEYPAAFQIQCRDHDTGHLAANSTSFFSCGLEEGHHYECSVRATIDAMALTIESRTFTVVTKNLKISDTPLSEDKTGIISGSIAGVLVIIGVLGLLAVVYSRRRTSAKTNGLRSSKDVAVALEVSKVPTTCSSNAMTENDDQTYCNISGMTLSQFQQYVQDEVLITRRFSELQANEAHPCTKGNAPENRGKNRFQNILPYDYNRVRVDQPENDYINASYISGASKPKEYIATQGPSPKTVEDFWQMLWHENCSIIIMLTDYVEHAKKKCEKYFPFKKSPTIDIEVEVRSSNIYDTHSVSVLEVRNGSDVRLIHHFHFMAWPDQSVPTHNAEMLLFYSRIRHHLKRHPSLGPVVVHCSAGVGRTGAYLAFDYVQQHYQSEGIIDIDSCVGKLRDQRMLMVQTKDQFLFLHTVALYSIKTTQYIYDAAQLSSLAQAGVKCDCSVEIDMASEWRELQALVPKFHILYFGASVLPENKSKNRRNEILALDSKRPMYSSPDGSNQLYINAVYCNGCFFNRAYIATQLPLKHTVADFWLMVYDCQPSCIVLLHNLLADDEDCPCYWPEPGQSFTSDWLEVKCDIGWKEQSTSKTVMSCFDITLSPVSGRMTASQTVSTKLFTTSLWETKSSAELPANLTDLLTAAMALRAYCVRVPQQTIVVQCRDGVTQCGLFLAAVNALHRLMETEQVSAFHTVDLLRSSRPEFVTSEAQYRSIYKLLELYRDSSNIYVNM